jgi:hypothetical protein
VTKLQELREQALKAVRSAFPVEEPPTADKVRNHHCPEREETSEIFFGRRWTHITVEDLMGNPALSLLTCAAFRYYLPALMIHSIEAPVELDCIPDDLVALLSPSRGSMNEHVAERLTGFPTHEVQAILSFLRFFQARELAKEWVGTGVPSDDISGLPTSKVLTRAIEYWTKQLPSSVVF